MESIPGCVLQLYVWLSNPKDAGSFALVSIAISALTTGYTSAMIAFDQDIDVPHRKNQPGFYGYIPDDNALRGRCFALMLLMSALHNLSRSLGVVLLATSDSSILVLFLGGEIALYLLYKLMRGDFYYWPPIDGTIVAILGSFLTRIATKVIADYSGCLQFRHAFDLGGLGFSLSMVWAQVMPFVALLLFYDNDELKGSLVIFLVLTFTLWLLLNIVFFCTIDLSYTHTFYGTMTAPQYTCMQYKTAEEDSVKFDAVFNNRIQFTTSIHSDVKPWVANNIARWRETKPDWFNVELIPDAFLPSDVIEAEGGARRRRSSSVSLRELVGGKEGTNNGKQQSSVHPE